MRLFFYFKPKFYKYLDILKYDLNLTLARSDVAFDYIILKEIVNYNIFWNNVNEFILFTQNEFKFFDIIIMYCLQLDFILQFYYQFSYIKNF